MVPYDRLLFAVGTQISTFGIPGVKENCCFLKDIDDARKIRRAIISLLESANMPEVSDEEKKKLLTFAVIGTGPSGIEFSGELRDFVENEVARFYPNLLRHVKIKLFDFAKSVLGPFDKTLQDAAVDHLTQEMVWRNDKIASWLPENYRIVEISLGNCVKEVKRDRILLNDGKVVPFGLCLWAGGNGPVPITLDLIKKLGKEQQDLQQVARGRLAVDPWMRVIGGDGDILAVGDCTCFSCNDKTKTLPATAQVASQQADYLATVLSKGLNMTMVKNDGVVLPPLRNKMESTVSESIASFAMNNDDFVAPFQYLDLGILAYIGGNEALAQLKLHPNVTTGITGRLGFGIWQSVYMAKQLSWKNQLLIMFDWIKTKAFGRDITQL
jgi:NADH dehydrogenase FAD-containing subunit